MLRIINNIVLFDASSFFSDIFKSLLIAAITAAVAAIFTKKYLKKILFVRHLDEYGFKSFVSNKNISERELDHIFSKASKIKILYVTGIGFFSDIRHQVMIKKALQRGADIEILLARKNNPFLKDVYLMEYYNSNRPYNGDLNEEIDKVHSIFEEINKECSNKLKVRYYSTEYRLPLLIATFDEEKNEKTCAWINITFPPSKASKHILMKLECNNDGLLYDDENFVDLLCLHFNSIWNLSYPWEETAEQYWNSKYKKALNSIKHTNNYLLLVSAQHPLVNGREPNEEFKCRLNAATAAYYKLIKEGKKVKIYVPGSIHLGDNVSLSEAGKAYLLMNNIPAEDIYADEMNIKYKNDEGVYNSADECYVASKIFKDGHFEKLYCFCSPFQVSKNQLFLLENDVLGDIYSIPSNDYFHNPYFEFSEIIPDVLFYDHSWQGKSFYGQKTRDERKSNV